MVILHLLWPGADSSKRTAEIAENLASLKRKIARANEPAVYVFGLLARDEYQLASRRDDDLGVRFWSWQIIGIDAFERHYSGHLLWVGN
jgi:hypothetical protein